MLPEAKIDALARARWESAGDTGEDSLAHLLLD
jgi:hypothetical protein